MLPNLDPASLEVSLSAAPEDVRRDHAAAVAAGRTSTPLIAHTLDWVLRALSVHALPVDSRLAVSDRLGDVLVTSRLAWVVAGMHPCLGSWLDEDTFLVGPVGDEITWHVPPLGLSAAASEVYVTLRRDGVSPGRAAELSGLVH